MIYRSKFFYSTLVSVFAIQAAYAGIEVDLSKTIVYNDQLPFITHHDGGSEETALAMNVQYAPVKAVRDELSADLNFQLKYFTGWNTDGEAHVTVITPPEYEKILKPYVSMKRIEELAQQVDIQHSVIDILGIGSGEAVINGKKEQTYFLIVSSNDLLKLRSAIYDEFVKNGGNKTAWDPAHYYPHITIGYTLRDLFEADGVIKDVNHSLDTRFELTIVN